MNRHAWVAWYIGATIAAPCASAQVLGTPKAAIPIAGVWRFDSTRSDNLDAIPFPRSEPRTVVCDPPSSCFMGPVGTVRRPSPTEISTIAAMRPGGAIRILVTDSVVTLRSAGGELSRWIADGRPRYEARMEGELRQTFAEWKGAVLRTEWGTKGDLLIIREFRPSRDAQTLELTEKLHFDNSSRFRDVTRTLVFVRTSDADTVWTDLTKALPATPSSPPEPPQCPALALGRGEMTPMTGTPPATRELILPPNPPARVRGLALTVRLHVNELGSVDSVDVKGLEDPEYLAKFRRAMQQMRFKPARCGDRAVPGWAVLGITL